MPGGAWRNFQRKMNALEISIPESVRPIENEILQNIQEPLAKL